MVGMASTSSSPVATLRNVRKNGEIPQAEHFIEYPGDMKYYFPINDRKELLEKLKDVKEYYKSRIYKFNEKTQTPTPPIKIRKNTADKSNKKGFRDLIIKGKDFLWDELKHNKKKEFNDYVRSRCVDGYLLPGTIEKIIKTPEKSKTKSRVKTNETLTPEELAKIQSECDKYGICPITKSISKSDKTHAYQHSLYGHINICRFVWNDIIYKNPSISENIEDEKMKENIEKFLNGYVRILFSRQSSGIFRFHPTLNKILDEYPFLFYKHFGKEISNFMGVNASEIFIKNMITKSKRTNSKYILKLKKYTNEIKERNNGKRNDFELFRILKGIYSPKNTNIGTFNGGLIETYNMTKYSENVLNQQKDNKATQKNNNSDAPINLKEFQEVIDFMGRLNTNNSTNNQKRSNLKFTLNNINNKSILKKAYEEFLKVWRTRTTIKNKVDRNNFNRKLLTFIKTQANYKNAKEKADQANLNNITRKIKEFKITN